MEEEKIALEDFELNIQVKSTSRVKAEALLYGMQGLVNDLGVDDCLGVLSKIKCHPKEFKKALSLMNNQMVLGLIKNF